jgi:3-oxoacyl-[acyl-carrier-protein] synthase-3
MQGARIRAVASVLGSEQISSDAVALLTGSPSDFRREKLGIDVIRVASASETPSSMAVAAIEELFLKQPEVSRDSIDFLILVTQNPDFILPSTACLVQHKAKLSRSILAYDVNLGCSGFVLALAQAKALIASGMAKRGLVVTSEVYNRVLNRSDRNTFGLFGDAAAATLIEECAPEFGLGEFFYGTDGGGADALIVRRGGAAMPEKSGGPDDYLHMDGKAVFKFVVKYLPPALRAFLDKQNLSLSDVDHWFFHQANRHMNGELCRLMGIPSEKAFFDIFDVGNTVSATIPIALERATAEGVIKGERIVLCGFGVGLSWGGCAYRLQDGRL